MFDLSNGTVFFMFVLLIANAGRLKHTIEISVAELAIINAIRKVIAHTVIYALAAHGAGVASRIVAGLFA